MQLMIPGEGGHVRLKDDHECWQSVDMHKKHFKKNQKHIRGQIKNM